jgi:hypothetical protein
MVYVHIINNKMAFYLQLYMKSNMNILVVMSYITENLELKFMNILQKIKMNLFQNHTR